MYSYLATLFTTVLIQIIGLFGIFFVLGFLLSFVQRLTHKNYFQMLGWKGILWTAWIGTPIHEIGHAFFAKLFRHKINRISLFEPNETTGQLGHVDHTYNSRSLYQRIGNFFIGAAPMIWGSLLLVLFLYFFVPNGKEIFSPLTNATNSFPSFFVQIQKTITNLFVPENIYAWNFWLFLYISFAISSHMAPSSQDQKNMWRGFFWIVIILIILNAIALLLGIDITQYILNTTRYLGVFTAIFVYALLLSTLHLLLSIIIFLPFKKRL